MNPLEARRWPWGTRLLYNHNPFYPLSALLTLYGIHRAVGASVTLHSGWTQFELLAGYTAVLAVVGFWVARLARVWDDARTVLLIVALLLVAMSAAFDRFLLVDVDQGAVFLLAAGGFVVAVTESLLHGLRLRLPLRYRGPYYLLFGLLLGYPLVLARLSKAGEDEAMPWGMLLFPALAAAVLLMLWPAARRRDQGLLPAGAPWRWPLYPWSLFTVLLVGVAIRSYSLGMTFEAGRGFASSFALWFLLPLLMAAAVLLLELGFTAGSGAARGIALVMPALAAVMLFCGPSCPQSLRFTRQVAELVAAPAQIALAIAGLFYAVGWLRGLRGGEIGLVACVALAAFVDRHTFDPRTLAMVWPWPLVLVGVVEGTLALWWRTSLRMIVASTALGLAATMAPEAAEWVGGPRDYLLTNAPLVALAIAGVARDGFARHIRRLAWPWLALFCAKTLFDAMVCDVPITDRRLLAACACVGLLGLYCYRERSVERLIGSLIAVAALVGSAARRYFASLEESEIAAGLPWMLWGTVSLSAAILVSIGKSGALGRIDRYLRRAAEAGQPTVAPKETG